MIIKNNKPRQQYLRYKIAGKVFSRHFNAYETIDIAEITSTSQILSNTYERRIRHIEDAFGYNYGTSFEIPGDPDFISFVIVSSTSLSGTISPLGSISVPEGENQTFTMTPGVVPFYLSAVTQGSSGGTISPSGLTVASNAYYYLSTLTIDGDANQVSAVTGNVSAVTTYEFSNVFTSHTISSSFAIQTGSTIFTMTPSTNFYLKSLFINSVDLVSGVTGSVSGATTYNLQNIFSGISIESLYKAYGQ